MGDDLVLDGHVVWDGAQDAVREKLHGWETALPVGRQRLLMGEFSGKDSGPRGGVNNGDVHVCADIGKKRVELRAPPHVIA